MTLSELATKCLKTPPQHVFAEMSHAGSWYAVAWFRNGPNRHDIDNCRTFIVARLDMRRATLEGIVLADEHAARVVAALNAVARDPVPCLALATGAP